MKYSNLLISSLLVSTALTTGANAASIYLAGDATAAGIALGVRNLSAQVFPAVASTSTKTGTNRLFVKFAQNNPNTVFTGTINVTGAKFVTTGISASAFAVGQTGASIGSITDLTAACTVTPGASTLILACDTSKVNGTTISTTSINGIVLSGIAFDNISALSTAGTSVSLDYTMKVSNELYDSAAATAVITSRNSLTGTSVSATTAPLKIAVANPTGSFLKFTTGTAAVIGSINFTLGAGTQYGLDLSTTLSGFTSGAELKVTSSIFSDDAAKDVVISGASTITVAATTFGAGFVTFTLPVADIDKDKAYGITVNFNGTKEIDTAGAGTTLITYVANASTTGSASNVTAPPAVTGTVSGLSRDGLSIDLNGLQPGIAQGARQYTSLVRVANTGTAAGTVTMIVSNETTGTVLGTYTSASIPVGASLQVSSAQIEAGAGITPSASVGYRVAISGAITGYAQHVTWNQDAGFFGDLSARRDVTTSINN